MNDKEIQVIDFAYLRMCAEHNYIYETGEAKLLLNYITNLQQENARLKETFEKITNYIKEHDYDYIYLDCKFLETQIYNDLLQMLNKIKEN